MDYIYLDNQATTPVDPLIMEAMQPFLGAKFANVGSSHLLGRELGFYVKKARSQVAGLFGCDPNEVVFTSGATESNNIAIQGLARACHHKGKHLITSPTEHKAVLQVCEYLAAEEGFELSLCPVDKYGRVIPSELEKLVRTGAEGTVDRTLLISTMGANNEIGTINPIKEIGAIAKKHGVFFHVDAAQWAGKVEFCLHECHVDLLSISGHKIYGPKGIGALYVNGSNPALKLKPLFYGGAQERGIRPGTQAVFLDIAMGKACELSHQKLATEPARLLELREYMLGEITKDLPEVTLVGHRTERLAGNLNLCFRGLDAEILMLALREVAVSTGSACTAKSPNPSHVLKAIGMSDEDARSCLRIGMGRFSTREHVEFATKRIIEHAILKRDSIPV